MRCEEIMKQDVRCLSGGQSVREAAKLMRDAAIGFLPVCDARGTVVGTVTDRDIVVRLAAEDATLETSVEHIMSKSVIACSPRDELDRAEELMAKHHKARIVCADDQGKPVGVISLSDIAQHEPQGERVAKLLREITEREVH